jgi:hypothetical protein
MKNRSAVVVYGNSLFSASIEASLRHQPGWAVMQVDNLHADAVAHLIVIHPVVVIVDMTDPLPEAVVTYLVQQPGTTLIGVDLRTSTMLVLHSQHAPLTSMPQLVDAIEQHIATSEGPASQT